MKKFLSILFTLVILINPVIAADYYIEPLEVNSKALDDASDSYRITVNKGRYEFVNPLQEKDLKHKLSDGYQKYKPLIWVTCGIVLLFLAPEFVVGLPALVEAQSYLKTNAVINKGQSVEVLVPTGQVPVLQKE